MIHFGMNDAQTRREAEEEIQAAKNHRDQMRYARGCDDDHLQRIEELIEVEERHIRRLLELTR